MWSSFNYPHTVDGGLALKKLVSSVIKFPKPNERFGTFLVIRNSFVISIVLYLIGLIVGFGTLPKKLKHVEFSIWLLLGGFFFVFLGILLGGLFAALNHNRKLRK